MKFQIAMTLSLSNSFIMTKKKSHFRILFYCLNSLICCSFPFLFLLNVSLLLGTVDAEMLRSLCLKPRADECFPLKAQSRSEYSQVCLVNAIISQCLVLISASPVHSLSFFPTSLHTFQLH